MCVVDLADVDPPRRARGDDVRRGQRIGRDAEGEREVVGGAEGQDADRLPGLDQRRDRAVDGAVAAGDDDRIDAVDAIPDQPRQRVPVAALADVEVEAVGGEAGDGVADRRPWPARRGG